MTVTGDVPGAGTPTKHTTIYFYFLDPSKHAKGKKKQKREETD